MLKRKILMKFDIYLIMVYVVSIFFDLYNGYVQQVIGTSTIIPTLFKGAIMFYSLYWSWNKTNMQKYVNFLLWIFGISTFYWVLCGYEIRPGSLLSDLFKLIYPYAILMYLLAHRNKYPAEKVLNYILLYGILISSSIILTDFLGIAVNSYGESYGYGVKGLFKAGNDTSVALIMCLCISFYYIEKSKSILYIAINLLILYTCLTIGTTSGMAGVAISLFCFIIMPFATKEKTSFISKGFIVLMLVFGISVIGSFVINIINTDSYTMNKYSVEYIMNGDARGYLEEAFLKYWDTYSLTDYIFGVGNTELYENVARILHSSHDLKRVEVDQWDILGAYGFLLGGAIFYMPLKYLYYQIIATIKSNRSIIDIWICVAMCLFVAHGYFAGHAFTNIMAMSVYSGFMYVKFKNL